MVTNAPRVTFSRRLHLKASVSKMEATVTHLGGVQFEVNVRGHKIYSDQPAAAGGFDEAPTPPELLLASLGACAAYYAAEYLRVHRLSEENLHVHVHAEKSFKPARLSSFRIEVDAPAAATEQHRAGITKAVERCLIHNTLLHPPQIEIAVPIPATI